MKNERSHNALEVHLTGFEPSTIGTKEHPQDKHQECLTKLESASGETVDQRRHEAVEIVGTVCFGTHLRSTSTHSGHTPPSAERNLTMTIQDTPVEQQFVAIPRHPTLDDVHAYMEFLTREHPDLHDVILTAEFGYANARQDLNPENRAPDESGED